MRRRPAIFFAILMAGVVAAVTTLPLWLGAVAGWAGRSRGFTFAAYERIGYSRFALRDVEVKRANVRVTIARAEADTPVLWLWRHWRNKSAPITASSWAVEVTKSTQPRSPSPDRGWMQLRGLLQRIAAELDRWLRVASTGPGVVRWPGGEISVESAKWSASQLEAKGLAFRALKADATLAFATATDVMRLTGRTTDGMLATTLESHGTNVTGDFTLWEQPGTLRAAFAPRGWMPAEGSVLARDWSFPGDRIKLGQHYQRVAGSAHIDWRAERFIADIVATGEPIAGKPAPPLEVRLRGNGDARAFTIESLQALLPGVSAQLSEPITIERSGKIRESAARFALQVDLARQPWFTATGTVNGEARLVSAISASSVVEFSLDARDVTARDVSLAAVAARGALEWPRLNIASATITGAAGEQLTWRGGWDFRAKQVLDSVVEGEIRRASIARWLPKQPEFDAIQLSAQATGTLAEMKHSGRAQIKKLEVRGMKPLAVSAEWQGSGATIEPVKLEVTANETRIDAMAKVSTTGLQLTALELTQAGTTRLKLRQPAIVRWKPQLQLESLHLAGREGSLTAHATGGEKGRVEISAREISSRWLSDLIKVQGPPLQLTLLALIGNWDRGPMVFSLSAGTSIELEEGRKAAVMAAARGDKDGVRVDALRVIEGDSTVVNATGRLPITFVPTEKPLLHIDPKGGLVLDATVAPNAAFWQKLAALTGVELKDPQAEAHLTGTWQQPRGNVSLKATKIAIDPKRVARPLPTIESLDVRVVGDSGGVTLDTFSVKVEGQMMRASGRLPVNDGKWGELFKEPLAVAQRGADLRVEVPDAEVAMFNRFLSAVLAPKGRVQADLQYKNGGLEGFLRLRDAASKPLGPLGVLQEISADIALSGRKLALRGVTAKSGGQPVTLSGTIELPENGQPIFNLTLRGENLPFVRQTGLLVRGDLDLKLQTPARGMPRLSGTVRLRDSLFLSDIRSFLPKGGSASPTRRPPYFAIETPPVNAWTLAVEVVGEEFMRARTPVFVGVASARFRLGGTLGEPRALGELAVDEGRVRMPFASFEITQGAVRLTEADPYEPAIYVRGTARRLGYDLTMEIDGTAAKPNIVFTSSPALDSEQVLLMVMTGAVPTNDTNKSGGDRIASVGYFLGSSLLTSLGGNADDADRLSIATGEKISREGNETYEAEYKVSDRWAVIAERDEFDAVNVGVKWRVFGGERERAGRTANQHATK